MTAAGHDREPSRAGATRTLPGGIRLCGPIVQIPGRTLLACPADIAELKQHIASCQAALDELRRSYPHG